MRGLLDKWNSKGECRVVWIMIYFDHSHDYIQGDKEGCCLMDLRLHREYSLPSEFDLGCALKSFELEVLRTFGNCFLSLVRAG